jgi:hypothetical protein
MVDELPPTRQDQLGKRHLRTYEPVNASLTIEVFLATLRGILIHRSGKLNVSGVALPSLLTVSSRRPRERWSQWARR